MRDIKFRACDKDKKVMYRVRNILWINRHISSVMLENGEGLKRLDEIVLMQYTGLKDINGVEIYEGDIVNYGQHTHLVRFGEFTDSDDFQYPATGQIGFYIVDTHTDETFPFYSMTYEIIGNIYENPGLLED